MGVDQLMIISVQLTDGARESNSAVMMSKLRDSKITVTKMTSDGDNAVIFLFDKNMIVYTLTYKIILTLTYKSCSIGRPLTI